VAGLRFGLTAGLTREELRDALTMAAHRFRPTGIAIAYLDRDRFDEPIGRADNRRIHRRAHASLSIDRAMDRSLVRMPKAFRGSFRGRSGGRSGGRTGGGAA